MATTKKTTAKAPAKAPAKAKKAVPKVSPEDLVAARQALEVAHAVTYMADLAVRRAYAYQGDFRVRDQDVAAAQQKLGVARANAMAAQAHFENLRDKLRAGK